MKEKKESFPVLQRYFSRILPSFLAVCCCFLKFPEHLSLHSTKPTNGCFRSTGEALNGLYGNLDNGIYIGVGIQI